MDTQDRDEMVIEDQLRERKKESVQNTVASLRIHCGKIYRCHACSENNPCVVNVGTRLLIPDACLYADDDDAEPEWFLLK